MKARKKRGTETAAAAPRQQDARPVRDPAADRGAGNPRDLLAIASLALLTLAAYANSFGIGFALDNKGLILNDPRIREATAANLALIFGHSYWWPIGESGLYRPLTTLSYLFNYAILGDGAQPAGYHWINLLLHISNAVLLYFLSLRLIRKFWPAVFLSALWAVHPASTESVTNIIGRSDLLAGIATFGGLLAYLKSTETAGFRRIAWLLALAALTAAGVFSKESAVTLVGVVVLYELVWWRERRQWRGLILGCAAMLIPVVAMLAQRYSVLRAALPAEFPFTDNPIAGADFWTGRITAISVIPRYLWLTIWPANLSADYSYPQIPLASGAQAWLGVTIVLAMCVGLAMLYRSFSGKRPQRPLSRTAFFLAGFSAITFLPVSNLLFPIGTIMADRFLYLPSAGLLGCLVIAIYAVLHRYEAERFAMPVFGVLILGLAIRTWARNPDWQDDATLARATVRSSPRSYKAHTLMAQVLFDGDPGHANIDRAIEEADRSVALLDSLPDVRNTAGVYRMAAGYYLTKGDHLWPQTSTPDAPPIPEALEAYRHGVQLVQLGIEIDRAGREAYRQKMQSAHSPANATLPPSSDSEGYRLLSTLYLRLGNLDQAGDAAAKARSSDPLDPDVYWKVANVFLARRQVEKAAAVFMTGMLVTSDGGLREVLIRLYQSGLDHEGCAIIPGPKGPALNPRCETVRRLMCAASVETVRARLESGRSDLAERQKQVFINTYGCPKKPLEEAAAEPAAF